jgi:hypothetical protein
MKAKILAHIWCETMKVNKPIPRGKRKDCILAILLIPGKKRNQKGYFEEVRLVVVFR